METKIEIPKALLVAVQLPDVSEGEFNESLAELRRLAKTLGYEVTGTATQRLKHFDPGAYVGTGKREELKRIIEGGSASWILVDHDLSPSQLKNLENETGAQVLDRTGVIIEIFHKHAKSRAAKAQVEIVRLKYLAPRMREAGKGKDRQGVGGRGPGESALELDRRKIRDRVAELTEELEGMDEERKTQRARRSDLARVALVGYTNAGKSTLMRALTGSEVYVADKLFATLDTTVRTLEPQTNPRILVSDTVGFIKKLPHGLVASFKSTLDEALEASLLCHVVDSSDGGFERQMQVTNEVLGEIGAGAIPHLLLMNKADRLTPEQADAIRAKYPDAMLLSAKSPEDVTRLHAAILAFFTKDVVEEELLVPYDRQELRGDVFARCEVLEERYEEGGVVFRLKAMPDVLKGLKARLAS
jgi:GTPase